ncbi:MAG: tRNA uridine-5-carboxymethylaminomethyl(34) synthesis GTPase MnmE, partial [Hyphomicrobiales bacterium]|nr:tRNA uridine-5-carboxymethylaminomethyl(34) synthesis GTPase MnmE [Hyphomicrobiales bacterium]
ASFTGEDCLEFQLHGSRAVINRMFRALASEAGTRIAQPGEFIRRAFDNGKLALTSVEGVADLIDAKTDYQRKQALSQAGGGLAARAEQWREMLLDALSLIAAEIDFSDEGEAPTNVLDDVRTIVGRLIQQLQHTLVDAERGEIVKNGFRVVLCGRPNVGKSTLMNALARRDVAIVTEHAGTTRDIIAVELDLGGVPVVLLDTAGLRETDDVVERLGVERTRQAMDHADLLLWLVDGASTEASVETDPRSFVVATKMDQAGALPPWAQMGISAHTGVGLASLISEIESRAMKASFGEPALVTNARQKACVVAAARHAEEAMARESAALEIVAEHLHRSASALEELVGRIGADDVLGTVFRRFCMGK